MRLFNESRDVLLAERLAVADTFWKRLRGLLGTREWPEGNALLISPCNSVHMFGMKYCLDVLFVDQQNLCWKPWRRWRLGKSKYAVGRGTPSNCPKGRCGEPEPTAAIA